ncbi:LysR family transcriptional regulator [Acinetobacter thermotolerans]|uniref:LysR family transcriptional regulator n=1 Tax=Acinetobacter thermotolerans TaxID=3151487 RepID=UPI00325B3A9D
MNIDIGDIKSFVTVAELKSISAAASKLNYLQSNMTAKIKKIENHYKRPLFIRKPKGVELTEAGLHLYEQYKKLIFTWEETENKIHQQQQYLRFGTNTSLGGMRFYPSLKKLYEAYPDLSITLKTGTTVSIEDELLQGHIDLAYILGRVKNKKLHYQLLANDELILIGKDVINHQKFEDCLRGQNIIVASDQCCYWTTLNQMYSDFHIQKAETIMIHDLEALINFTQIGMGISMIAKSIAEQYQIEYFREIPAQYKEIGLYLVTRNDHAFSPLENQFIGLNDTLN